MYEMIYPQISIIFILPTNLSTTYKSHRTQYQIREE